MSATDVKNDKQNQTDEEPVVDGAATFDQPEQLEEPKEARKLRDEAEERRQEIRDIQFDNSVKDRLTNVPSETTETIYGKDEKGKTACLVVTQEGQTVVIASTASPITFDREGALGAQRVLSKFSALL